MGGGQQELVKGLHEPFEDFEAMQVAVNKFQKGVESLRQELGIQNYLLVNLTSARQGNGETSLYFTQYSFGDPDRFESMAAYSLGREQRLRQERIALIQNGQVLKSGQGE